MPETVLVQICKWLSAKDLVRLMEVHRGRRNVRPGRRPSRASGVEFKLFGHERVNTDADDGGIEWFASMVSFVCENRISMWQLDCGGGETSDISSIRNALLARGRADFSTTEPAPTTTSPRACISDRRRSASAPLAGSSGRSMKNEDDRTDDRTDNDSDEHWQDRDSGRNFDFINHLARPPLNDDRAILASLHFPSSLDKIFLPEDASFIMPYLKPILPYALVSRDFIIAQAESRASINQALRLAKRWLRLVHAHECISDFLDFNRASGTWNLNHQLSVKSCKCKQGGGHDPSMCKHRGFLLKTLHYAALLDHPLAALNLAILLLYPDHDHMKNGPLAGSDSESEGGRSTDSDGDQTLFMDGESNVLDSLELKENVLGDHGSGTSSDSRRTSFSDSLLQTILPIQSRNRYALCIFWLLNCADVLPASMFCLGTALVFPHDQYSQPSKVIPPSCRVTQRLYEHAAMGGNASAAVNLGMIFIGQFPFPSSSYDIEHFRGMSDLVNSIKWWEQAAKNNQVDAILNLGHVYSDGGGKHADPVNLPNLKCPFRATEMWRKAAALDDSRGHLMLASAYERGSGCTKDLFMAIKHYQIAMQNGNEAVRQSAHDHFARLENLVGSNPITSNVLADLVTADRDRT